MAEIDNDPAVAVGVLLLLLLQKHVDHQDAAYRDAVELAERPTLTLV